MSDPVQAKHLIPPESLPIDCLLECVAGSGAVRDLVVEYPLAEIATMSETELRKRGTSTRAARRLCCAFELARRASLRSLSPGVLLRSTQQIFEAYHDRLRHEKKEHFIALLMNAKNRLIREEIVSIGILTASLVHPREVFMPAIRHSAAGLVLLHNHPSGDPEPSPEDHEVTRRLSAVGELVGCRILDHVVIADGNYVSFLERGLITP